MHKYILKDNIHFSIKGKTSFCITLDYQNKNHLKMLKLFFLVMIVLLSIVIELPVHGLSFLRDFKEAKSDCISLIECCSGTCCNNKCSKPCKPANSDCTSDFQLISAEDHSNEIYL